MEEKSLTFVHEDKVAEPVGAGVYGWSRNFHPAPAPTPSLQYI